jgi:hypothetical protein
MKNLSLVIDLPVDEYRSHPIPYFNADKSSPKLGSCFVPAEALTGKLGDWLHVNPRVPSMKSRSDTLKGPVANAIVSTLMEKPEMMCLMNNGITLLVEKAVYTKNSGGKGQLSLTFSDPVHHGVANGGHTLAAIMQVAEDDDRPDPWPAMVRLHVYEGLAPEVIPSLAEGLNRSMQVDDKSLENLRGLFNKIKDVLAGAAGADKIAYSQGDDKPVDVQQILSFMAMLNIDQFPDRKSHPNKYFGQQRKVLTDFVEDQAGPMVYDRMLPKLHEILVLADEIQRLGVKHLPSLKVSKPSGKNTGRVAAEVHKQRPAYFSGKKIDGFFPVGWLQPMLAAFRRNISVSAWEQGEFAWISDPFALLNEVIEEFCRVIREEHIENASKPAEVGRKEAAYRGCYAEVAVALADG